MLAVMEAAQLQRYHAAYPHMTNMLSQMSDDDCRKSLLTPKKQDASKGDSVRVKVFQKMMEPFLPPSYRQQGYDIAYAHGKVIEGMSSKAAKGMVEALKAGFLGDNVLWLQVYRIYPSIVATADKGDN